MGGWSLHSKCPQAEDMEAGEEECEHPATWPQAEKGASAPGGSALPAGFTTKPSSFIHNLPKAHRKKNNIFFFLQ